MQAPARRFIGIDPGPVQSGVVLLDPRLGVVGASVLRNGDVINWLKTGQHADGVAIEWFSSYGMSVGREVFDTCLWAGRFVQAWPYPDDVYLIPRAEVKLALCGSS